MIVEIKGVEIENKGSYSMLLAILEGLKHQEQDIQFAVRVTRKFPAKALRNIPAHRKISFRKSILDLNILCYFIPPRLRTYMKNAFGVVTEADISLVLDASGFSYSDQWSAVIRIYHLHNELRRFKKHRKEYVFLPQAFGPFTRKFSCRMIANSFKHASFIYPRDSRSQNYILRVTGPLSNLRLRSDFTNLLPAASPPLGLLETNAVCIIPNANMMNPRNAHGSWLQRYEDILLISIAYYRELGLKPFFLNHGGCEDTSIITQLNAKLELPLKIISEPDPHIIKGIIAASDAVLCSRYHGCVSALSQGIACIGTSWSHKYDELYDQYNATQLLLQPNVSESECKQIIDHSLAFGSKIHSRIQTQAIEHKNGSLEMWKTVNDVLAASQSFSRLADFESA